MRRKLKSEDRRQKTEACPERSRGDRSQKAEGSIQHRVSRIEYRGFTLTEVIVASTLLILAIVPILKALTTAHVNTTIIERRTKSLILSRAKLDKIKACSIYNYTNSGASFTENNTVLDDSYLCNVTDNSGDPLKQITISVGYDLSGDGNLADTEIEVTLSTLIARRW